MANTQPSGSQIPDAWSIKLTFSLIVTFYLTITENRTKTFLFFAKKKNNNKNADISKINRVLVLKEILSETKYLFVTLKCPTR